MKETYTLYCTCYISLPLGSTFFNHDAVSENNKKLYKIGLIYQFSCRHLYIHICTWFMYMYIKEYHCKLNSNSVYVNVNVKSYMLDNIFVLSLLHNSKNLEKYSWNIDEL